MSTPQGRRYAAQQAAKGSKFLARQYGKYQLGKFTSKAKDRAFRSYRRSVSGRVSTKVSNLNRKRKSKSASNYRRRNRSHRRRKRR